MKKITCLLIIITVLISLVSCGGYYEPVPSDEEEARVLMTLSLDGERYEVRYELYRAMFLAYRSAVDGGDSSVWSGDNKDEYIAEIHAMIVDRVTDIYAAFHLARELGIDLYSSKIEKQIKEYVKTGVEGGIYNGETLGGYESYDEYLDALAKLGLNYSVQATLFRYAIAINEITAYYAGEISDGVLDPSLSGGALEYTKDDVRQFYFGDGSVRVMMAFVQSAYEGAWERADRLREKMIENAGDDDAVATAIISGSISSPDEVQDGVIIGKYSLDEENYAPLTEAAFITAPGQVSDIVQISAGDSPGYYIIYSMSKSTEHFEAHYGEIEAVFVENEIGRILLGVQTSLISAAESTEALSSLDYSAITYPTVNKK